MSKTGHIFYLSTLVAIVILITLALILKGVPYYKTSIEERVFHQDHILLKPSGIVGHGIGIAGSLSLIIGMGSYMARKRYRFLSRIGILKHWLEFHIFLCTLGTFLIIFHTSYKIGGLVAISFWSMVAVFMSGIIGRFIYIQIPRTIEGRELSLNEVQGLKSDFAGVLRSAYDLDTESFGLLINSQVNKTVMFSKNPIEKYFRRRLNNRQIIRSVKDILNEKHLSATEIKKLIALVKNDIRLNYRIERLERMQNLFKYWHVAHLPFALVMLIIMFIHIGVTLLFGYRWIF
jgi:hypothetical protein